MCITETAQCCTHGFVICIHCQKGRFNHRWIFSLIWAILRYRPNLNIHQGLHVQVVLSADPLIITVDTVIHHMLQGIIEKCISLISHICTQLFHSSPTFFKNAENTTIHGGTFNQYNGTVVNNTNIVKNAGIATITLSYKILMTLNFHTVP